MRWGVARGDLDHNPFDGQKKPNGSVPRERALSDEEIAKLWNMLPLALAKSKACQRIVKLCLLTAQRVGEVSGMAIAEIDFASAIWTIPRSRSKNKHAHTVPLTDQVIALVREALADAGRGALFVFPGKDGKGSLPSMAVAKTIGRAQKVDDDRPLGRFGIPIGPPMTFGVQQ